MPGRHELCFSSTLSFYFPFMSSSSHSHSSFYPAALQWFLSQIFRSPSFLCLSVDAHVRCDCHLHSYVFFPLCPSYSCVPHGIWSWQLFCLELAFTPTGVIAPHCFSPHVTASCSPALSWEVAFINKGNRWALFSLETMEGAGNLGEGSLFLTFWSSETWQINSCRLVFKSTDLQDTHFCPVF